MSDESVKKKMTNARCRDLSIHQIRMLELAASRSTGMVSIRWFMMRTARALEKRGLGEVRDHFDYPDGGWSLHGWVFVVNEVGRALVKENENGC